MIAKEFGLPLDAWMTGRRTLWETQLQEKCCCPHVESCYISCYATEPASQPASLLHWFEVNAVTLVPTQPAAHLIGLMSPLLSFPLFFFFFISSLLPLFPSPFSHFPIPSQLPDETGLMEAAGGHAGVWIPPRGAGGFILGSRHCQIDFCLPFLSSAGMALCLSESVFHCESENDNSFIRRYFIGYIFLTATRNLIL